jgi:hypothetical protein
MLYESANLQVYSLKNERSGAWSREEYFKRPSISNTYFSHAPKFECHGLKIIEAFFVCFTSSETAETLLKEPTL